MMVVCMSSVDSRLYVWNDGCLYVQRGQLSVCLAVMVVSCWWSAAPQSRITLGIAGPDIAGDAHPGNWINSVGYQSDTGHCFSSHHRSANTEGEKFGIGTQFHWWVMSSSFFFFFNSSSFFSFFLLFLGGGGGGRICLLWCLFQPNKAINFIR